MRLNLSGLVLASGLVLIASAAGAADFPAYHVSRLRAESVRSILMAGGIAPDRIESPGYGKTRPVASNATAAGKAQNRRVEIVLQGATAR